MKANEKLIMYPAVVYDDVTPDTYGLVLKDLGLITEGDTIEQAYAEMVSYLEMYYRCVMKTGETLEQPSTFESVKKAKTKNIVLIVSSAVKKGGL